MAAYTVPMKSAAFLTLLGIDATTQMSHIVPPPSQEDSDSCGIVLAALEKAKAVVGGETHFWSSDEVENAREDVQQVLMDVYYEMDPKDPGCLDIYLTENGIPVRLHVANAVVGPNTTYNGSSEPFRYTTRVEMTAFTTA